MLFTCYAGFPWGQSVGPLSPRWSMGLSKKVVSGSLKMQFPAFWASKSFPGPYLSITVYINWGRNLVDHEIVFKTKWQSTVITLLKIMEQEIFASMKKKKRYHITQQTLRGGKQTKYGTCSTHNINPVLKWGLQKEHTCTDYRLAINCLQISRIKSHQWNRVTRSSFRDKDWKVH